MVSKRRIATRLLGIELRGGEPAQEPVSVADELAEHRRGCIRSRAHRVRVVRTLGREHRELGDLPPVRVDDRQALVRTERDDGRPAGTDEVRLEEGILR